MIGWRPNARLSGYAVGGAALIWGACLSSCSGNDAEPPAGTGGSADAGGADVGLLDGSAGSGEADARAPDSSAAHETSTEVDASMSDMSLADDTARLDGRAEASDGPLSCPSLPSLEAGAPAEADGGEGGDAWSGVPGAAAPLTLEETGLYCDISTGLVAPGVKPYEPQFELWSDGAVKSRWISLPPGAQIDTSNPDHWSFPVGTKFWKEFRYDDKRVETRMILRYGTGANDFLYAAYQWSTDGKSATLVPALGLVDVAPIGPGAEGPLHDIPSQAQCTVCHGKLSEHILGFGAIQLSHSLPGENLSSLIRDNLITNAPEAGGYAVPGNPTERAALGYLHTNCGICHNDSPLSPTAGFYRLRLLVAQATVESTDAYKTAVNVAHTWLGAPAEAGVGHYRIHGGDPDDSEIIFRMSSRDINPNWQMPPVGTKIIDPTGLATLKTWITELPPPAEAGADAAVDATTE